MRAFRIREGTESEKEKNEKLTAVVAPVLAMSMALTACSTSGGDKKTSTNSSSGGDSKSEEKLAAKQVLNRTETNEIPTMDTSKNTDTLGSQILGNTMEGLYRLDKDNKPIPAAAESSTKSEDGKNIHSNYVKMQNGQMVIL